MPNLSDNKVVPIIGLQWGDEGKGKGVARIASSLNEKDLIVRFQGGNNAGHTIWHDGVCFVFHLIPSGVFGKSLMHMGAGMVIDPASLKEEAMTVPANIEFKSRLSVSPHAVLVVPTHKILDNISEKSKGTGKIGSTGRGIGPAYTDFTWRKALRVGDIVLPDFKEKYEALRNEHKEILKNNFKFDINEAEFAELEGKFFEGLEFLGSISLKESAQIIEESFKKGGKVIAEGAQGTLLDLRFGNYPYVTSSHTVAGGISTGLGIPPSQIGNAIGILKAYTTKVGEGPFPTELGGEKSAVWCRDKKLKDEKEAYLNPNPNSSDEFEQGIALRQLGNEVGATTGRLRRTGWLDLPLAKYACFINDCKEIVLAKLDILNGFKEIKVCTAYKINGIETESVPFDLAHAKIEPVYKTFPGWQGKLSDYIDKDGTLPKEAMDYIKYLENALDVKVIYAGTGPEEHHVVERFW